MTKNYMIKAFAVMMIGGGLLSAPAQASLFGSLSQKFNELSACTMDGAKAAFYDQKKFSKYAEKCIKDQNMAKKNPNATTKFAGLCKDKKNKSVVEKNTRLQESCKIVIALVDGHQLKESTFSTITKAAHGVVKEGKKAVNIKVKEATGGFSLECSAEKARIAFNNPEQKLSKYVKSCISDQNAAIKNVNASRKFLALCKEGGALEDETDHPKNLHAACKALEAIEDKLEDNALSTASKMAKHAKKEVVARAKKEIAAKAEEVVETEEKAVEQEEQAVETEEKAVEQEEQAVETEEKAVEQEEQAVEASEE